MWRPLFDIPPPIYETYPYLYIYFKLPIESIINIFLLKSSLEFKHENLTTLFPYKLSNFFMKLEEISWGAIIDLILFSITTLLIKSMSFSHTLPAIRHFLLSINFSIFLIFLFSSSVFITDENLESPEILIFFKEYFSNMFFESKS